MNMINGGAYPVHRIHGGADMPPHVGQQAVVIGGSLTGLMTARVLADHVDRVTMLERDPIDERPALHQSIPPIPVELQRLIRQMARDNLTWGQRRIANELRLKLGLRISPHTVRKYMPTQGDRAPGYRVPSQRWQTFVRHHGRALIVRGMAADLLTRGVQAVSARIRQRSKLMFTENAYTKTWAMSCSCLLSITIRYGMDRCKVDNGSAGR
jgi:hypothetical protein